MMHSYCPTKMYFFVFVRKLFYLNCVSVFSINYMSVLCWFFIGDNFDIAIAQQAEKEPDNKLTQQLKTNDWKRDSVKKSVDKCLVRVEIIRLSLKISWKIPSQLSMFDSIDVRH